MASLRRPSQYYPAKAPSAPRPTEAGRPRQPLPGNSAMKKNMRKSTVEDRMKTRRMSMRYVDNDFGVLAPGASGADFLNADPYKFQYTLDVAPPLEQDEYDAGVSRPAAAVRPPSVYDDSPRSFAERRLEAEEAQGGNVQDEQIRLRAAAAPPQQEWDFSVLAKGDVDINTYIRKTLTGADEDEKKRFIAALKKHREANAKDLQKNVFKHYAEFVNISKEISTLENDMLELKELLNEWKTVPQLMGMDDTLAPTLDKEGNVHRHRSKRNSPLDLQQMYRAQITHLWSTVEGSQKYLNLAPGRHLVFETHSFVELNAATYKAKQNVSLFLLNDLLLVAGRRRLKAAQGATTDPDYERGRMVAERCWVLADLMVIDLKDSGDLTNALKIKRGKEVCVYRAQKPEDKKALLGAFRQVSNDLAEKRRKENEAEQERRRTLWQGEGGGGSRLTMAMSMWGGDGTPGARPITTIGTSLTDSKDLLWIDEFGDDLTMAIATQDWEEGVKLVSRGQDLLRTVGGNAQATELLTFKLDTLRPNLVTAIAHDLSSPKIRKASAARLISLLIRLGSTELARDTFLKARHDLMLHLIRGIKHEGDISLYISELSVVCFTILRHTADWYQNAFKDGSMASGFVTWARDQIEYFGQVFRRQVYAPTIEKNVIDECHKVTMSAAKKLLREPGLDFTFLLNAVTSADPPPAPVSFVPTPVATPMSATGPAPTSFEAMIASRPGVVKVDNSNFGFKSLNTNFSPISPMSEPGQQSAQSASSEVSLSQGTTAPLSISRRRQEASGTRAPSGTSASNVTASPPRPPPRSDRRSRPPPAQP